MSSSSSFPRHVVMESLGRHILMLDPVPEHLQLVCVGTMAKSISDMSSPSSNDAPTSFATRQNASIVAICGTFHLPPCVCPTNSV